LERHLTEASTIIAAILVEAVLNANDTPKEEITNAELAYSEGMATDAW
jgi:hypothetical protein